MEVDIVCRKNLSLSGRTERISEKESLSNSFYKVMEKENWAWLERGYGVKLHIENIFSVDALVGQDTGINNVYISSETLEKMEDNPKLKQKILNEIREFGSQKEMEKIRALQPPVKSAGILIYPDGSSISWLEGYSYDENEKVEQKGKLNLFRVNSTDTEYRNALEKMIDYELVLQRLL